MGVRAVPCDAAGAAARCVRPSRRVADRGRPGRVRDPRSLAPNQLGRRCASRPTCSSRTRCPVSAERPRRCACSTGSAPRWPNSPDSPRRANWTRSCNESCRVTHGAMGRGPHDRPSATAPSRARASIRRRPNLRSGLAICRSRCPRSSAAQTRSVRSLEFLMGARLVTLRGLGGIGKTSLALRVAADSATEFPDGVWFVDLAYVAPAAPMSERFLAALGLPSRPEVAPLDQLLTHLRPLRALLVVDNCERQIAEIAELVGQIVRVAPDLHVLATSRTSLAVAGESVWQVGPLDMPTAVELFAERARLVRQDFELTDTNRPRRQVDLREAGRHSVGDRVGRRAFERSESRPDPRPPR